jgi:hypothetical protein
MWNGKLYDEMLYGVILFRYFLSFGVFSEAEEKGKMEIDLWDKRVNRISKKP